MTANQINYANHLEGVRHNMAMEAETKRANMAGEAIGMANASSSRAQASAALWQAQNTQYYNQAWASTQRENVSQGWANTILGSLKSFVQMAGNLAPLFLTRVTTPNVSKSSNRYLM